MKKTKTSKEQVKETIKITTAKLIEEITKAEGIISAIGDGITILDRTFKILYENQVHRDIMGDNAGKYCYRAYQKLQGICSGCPVALTFKDGKVHTVQREVQIDEGIRYFEITASPLQDSEGNIIAGIEVVREITERKQIEETLKLSEKRYRSFVQKFRGIAYRSKMDWIPLCKSSEGFGQHSKISKLQFYEHILF